MTLLPGETDDGIICTLSVSSIRGTPQYEALSYYWGQSDDISSVKCDGRVLSVTPNLLSVLQHLRNPDVARTSWVDAICIDQGNALGKATQIPLMKAVYMNATSVVAWLGPGDDKTAAAFALVEFLAQTRELYVERGEALVYRSRRDLELGGRAEYIIPRILYPGVAALLNLLDEPFWNRCWVVQELAVARNVSLHCGTSCMSWDRFLNGIFHADKTEIPGLEEHAFVTTKIRRAGWERRTFHKGESGSLLHLLAKYRSFEATLPEDKIYAFCGLARDYGDHGIQVNIDYSAGKHAAYQSLALKLLTRPRQPMDVLSVPRVGESSEMPSWVPDWKCTTVVVGLREEYLDGGLMMRYRATPEDSDAGSS
jgi:hypothetical protein